MKPDGTLTVTYELQEASTLQQPDPPAPEQPAAPTSIRERLAQLDDLRSSGVISDEEYAAKRARILDAL